MSLGKWIGLFALGVSLYILWQIRAIILLVFTAVILATALNRLVRWFQKSGANRGLAIALVVGISLTFLVGFLAIISIPLADQFEQLRQLLPEWLEQLRTWLNWLQGVIPGRMVKNLPSFGDLTQQLQALINWVIVHFYLFFSNFLTLILNSVLIVAMTLMLLANPQQYRRALIQFFPAFYRYSSSRSLLV